MALGPVLGAAAWLLAGPLTLLRCGDEQAAALGLDTGRARAAALACAVALTAGAVSAVGALGFVGLLVPHVALAVFGADLRATLPGAALLGAVVVGGADAGPNCSPASWPRPWTRTGSPSPWAP